MENHIEELYNYLVEKKCKDIEVYDLTNETQQYDYVMIFNNANALQNKKFAMQFMQDLEIVNLPEGYHKGEWIVFDFDKYVLHSFIPSSRAKYNLDKLWQSKKMNIGKQNKK